MQVAIETILLPPNVREGLDLEWLTILVRELNDGTYYQPPIQVRRHEITSRGQLWTLTNGRHRFIAHLVVGSPTVEAELDDALD